MDNHSNNINAVKYEEVLQTDSPQDSLELDFRSRDLNLSPCFGLEVQMSLVYRLDFEIKVTNT